MALRRRRVSSRRLRRSNSTAERPSRPHASSICGQAHRSLVVACVTTRLDGGRDVTEQETVHARVPWKLTDRLWRRMQRVQDCSRAGRIEDDAIEDQQVTSPGNGWSRSGVGRIWPAS